MFLVKYQIWAEYILLEQFELEYVKLSSNGSEREFDLKPRNCVTLQIVNIAYIMFYAYIKLSLSFSFRKWNRIWVLRSNMCNQILAIFISNTEHWPNMHFYLHQASNGSFYLQLQRTNYLKKWCSFLFFFWTFDNIFLANVFPTSMLHQNVCVQVENVKCYMGTTCSC